MHWLGLLAASSKPVTITCSYALPHTPTPTSGMHLFSARFLNCSTHMPDTARCSANRSLRRLFSGSVLIRLLMSWIVDYASRAASAVTLLSCVDSRNRFAAALSSATLYSIARRPQRVFRMCSYL